jgi:hypothetical protein
MYREPPRQRRCYLCDRVSFGKCECCELDTCEGDLLASRWCKPCEGRYKGRFHDQNLWILYLGLVGGAVVAGFVYPVVFAVAIATAVLGLPAVYVVRGRRRQRFIARTRDTPLIAKR